MHSVTQTHFLVYKITNTINNKIYIGCHKTNNPDDNYMGSGKYLKYSQAKYGLENFNKEILFDFDNSHDMFIMEKKLISKLNPEYNLHEGGSGGWQYLNKNKLNTSKKRLDSMKEVGLKKTASIKRRYYNNPLYCKNCRLVIPYEKRFSNEFCSSSCSASYNNKGRKHSEETKMKISRSMRSKNLGVV